MFSEATQKPRKPDWYKKTERLLRRKKYLPVEIENLRLQLGLDREAGARVVADIESGVAKKTNISSPTETAVIKYDTKDQAIRRKEILLTILDNTVKAFNRDEHQVYYLRYELEWRIGSKRQIRNVTECILRPAKAGSDEGSPTDRGRDTRGGTSRGVEGGAVHHREVPGGSG